MLHLKQIVSRGLSRLWITYAMNLQNMWGQDPEEAVESSSPPVHQVYCKSVGRQAMSQQPLHQVQSVRPDEKVLNWLCVSTEDVIDIPYCNHTQS